MKKYLINYIKENSKVITVLALFIAIGIVAGIIEYQFTKEESTNELKESIVSTLDISKQDNFDGINVIKNGITTNLILVLLIYFSTITIISPALVSLFNFIKGFSLGIYIPIIFNIFGVGNGILSVIFLVVLPNIIFVPAYIFLSTNAINLHYYIISKDRNESKTKVLIKQLTFFIISFSFIFLSVLLEQILSTNVINIYKMM